MEFLKSQLFAAVISASTDRCGVSRPLGGSSYLFKLWLTAVRFRLLPLLEASLPYLENEDLRDVPLAILKSMESIPSEYLDKLTQYSSAYQVCTGSLDIGTLPY